MFVTITGHTAVLLPDILNIICRGSVSLIYRAFLRPDLEERSFFAEPDTSLRLKIRLDSTRTFDAYFTFDEGSCIVSSTHAFTRAEVSKHNTLPVRGVVQP